MFQVNLAEELVNIGQKKISRIKHAETKGFFLNREEPKQYGHTTFLKNNLTKEGGGKRS